MSHDTCGREYHPVGGDMTRELIFKTKRRKVERTDSAACWLTVE